MVSAVKEEDVAVVWYSLVLESTKLSVDHDVVSLGSSSYKLWWKKGDVVFNIVAVGSGDNFYVNLQTKSPVELKVEGCLIIIESPGVEEKEKKEAPLRALILFILR